MNIRDKESRKNPAERSNFISQLFFGWTAPIFWKGAKRDLNVTDLYDPLKSDESESLGDLLEREWEKELQWADQEATQGKAGSKKRRREPNLALAIFRIFWARYMVQGLLLFAKSAVLQLMLPILQRLIISYFNSARNVMTRNEVLVYTGLMVIVTFNVILITHHTILRMRQIGMCVRVACCSMIYRKILRLNQTAVSNTASGQVANLISNDVSRFDNVLVYLHYIWIIPIQFSMIGYMMWQSVGSATVVGMGAVITMTILVQGYLSKLGGKLRSKIAKKTDERVQLMSELISGIQVVKMYSWEKPFEMMVSKVRALEIKFISYTSYLRGYHLSMVTYAQQIGVYCTLVCFVLMGNQLTAEIAFVVVGLFSVLQETCTICLPLAIVLTGEAIVSLKRVQEFLLLDGVERSGNAESSPQNGKTNTETGQRIRRKVGIRLTNVTANWVRDQIPCTLSNISMEVKSQSLCTIVGPVGSGKSSLLHLLLGELSVKSGRVSFSTGERTETIITSRNIRISYASQDPWLFAASIRDNILFGQSYDRIRYQEVTRVCALHKDFEDLLHGDLTFVGERGTSLSGGQKARVNLARAVYRDAELYLLDDPLSAVDAQVGRHLFDECIIGFLKGKTRILVTHQLQYLPQADTVVVLKRGFVERQSTYEELVQTNFHMLNSEESEETEESEKPIETNCRDGDCEKKVKRKSQSVTADDDSDQQSKATEKSEGSDDVGVEKVATGNIPSKVYKGFFLAGGNLCSLASVAVVYLIGQIASSGTDYWLTYWTNQETRRATSQWNVSYDIGMSYSNGTGELHRNQNLLLPKNLGIYVYTACISGCIFFVTLRSMLFVRMCMNASRSIHDSMFANLIRATMRFFNTNPSGRILNRFSKDVGAMDELLPKVMLEAIQILTVMIGIFVLVGISNHWMIPATLIVCGIFYLARRYYLKTARDVKRLEGITKSPMFSHACSTLDGLATIRSRGILAEDLLRREFDRHQDMHTGAWYLNLATATAFEFYLDLISCAFFACVCFSFILMDNGETSGGFVGLAISQCLLLTSQAQYGIRQSTELVSQMTSVERILQYTNLPKEGPFTTEKPPPPSWPSEGGLIIKDVTMRYADNKPPVLKNLNLSVKPGWKVGIVGRTGAGKSSLISALFRLTGDGLEGEIALDGIDTKSVGLHELRPRISIIPQEPVLFSASLRHNLDPFEQYSDAELWDSVREVELGDVVPSLDFHVHAGGANFSVGQRQLICLARAILRNNKLLVLDEATANVDRQTDFVIQNTIRRRFANCTVLTIAHRLNTIMDSDRVLVMSRGQMVEFGHPHLLLENNDGHFSKMVRQTGTTTAAKLSGIAATAFLPSPEFSVKPNDPSILSSIKEFTHL